MTDLAIPAAPPTAQDIALARESGRVLSAVLRGRAQTRKIEFHDDKGAVRAMCIPASALRLLHQVLTEMGQGNAVAIVPMHTELTTREAADVLEVSHPFLVQLLETGQIPSHQRGTQRRVFRRDVIACKTRMDTRRRRALDELTAQAQELGMGY